VERQVVMKKVVAAFLAVVLVVCGIVIDRAASVEARSVYPITANCYQGHPTLHVIDVGIENDVNGNPELGVSDPEMHICPGDTVKFKANDSLPQGLDVQFDTLSMPVYLPVPAQGPAQEMSLDFYARPSWWTSSEYTICQGKCGSGGLTRDPHIIIMGP